MLTTRTGFEHAIERSVQLPKKRLRAEDARLDRTLEDVSHPRHPGADIVEGR